jgi:hypothetical protein
MAKWIARVATKHTSLIRQQAWIISQAAVFVGAVSDQNSSEIRTKTRLKQATERSNQIKPQARQRSNEHEHEGVNKYLYNYIKYEY